MAALNPRNDIRFKQQEYHPDTAVEIGKHNFCGTVFIIIIMTVYNLHCDCLHYDTWPSRWRDMKMII